MGALKFPYTELPIEPTEAFPDRKTTLRPILSVNIIYGRNQMITNCLIDSGSNFCLFNAEIAKLLGIPLRKGEKEPVTGIVKGRKIAYMHQVNLQIGPILIPAYVGFCDRIEHLPFGILGQEGFFSFFKVTFDLPEKSFQLEFKR